MGSSAGAGGRAWKRRVVVVAAGAALTVACGKPSASSVDTELHINPPPNPPEPEHTQNPPALPTWDEVGDGRPEGATNPPVPELIVTPDGAHCYKHWRGAMLPPGPNDGDRVQECPNPDDCGTEIVCPEPRAAELRGIHANPPPTSNPPPPPRNPPAPSPDDGKP